MKRRQSGVILAMSAAVMMQGGARAASLTDKDVQVMVRAIGFLQPQPADGGIIAIAYDASNPASKQDAEVISGHFGTGLKAGRALLIPRVMDERHLTAQGIVAIIAANGVDIDAVAAAGRVLHVPCMTGEISLVRAGRCVLSVRSDPKVEITVSRVAAASGDVTFASAFLMMVNQF